MEDHDLVQFDVLKKAFAVLEEQMDRWKDSDFERIDKIFNLLGGTINKDLIKKNFIIIKAEYAILPGRNIDKMLERVAIHFDHKVEGKAAKILSLIIFGTENAFEESSTQDLLEKQLMSSYGLEENATLDDEVENAKGRFGFDITNPIPVNGIDKIRNYFAKLRLITGESFTYERKGSFKSEALPFLIDLYEILNPEKEVIARLYVYAYHGKTTGKVPEGFKMISG